MEFLKNADFKDIEITDGFWKQKQIMNEKVSAPAVYEQFKDNRFKALDFDWDKAKKDDIHFFWDSDVAKWIEGVCYIYQKTKNEDLMKIAEDAVAKIVKFQREDGYFNSYFQQMEPENIFKVRNNHELYTAGHLFEAAVAYKYATGKTDFLDAMSKFADYIYQVFVVEKSAAFVTGGHPEIELALYKLYNETKSEKHLELFKFFIEQRGTDENIPELYERYTAIKYAQDHAPLKKQDTAEGHAVRAMYLYSAMVDYARKFNDEEYFEACEKIFNDVVTKKMYITGGIGSSSNGEAFCSEYYLPNETAYAETCAAISFALFCMRMQGLSTNSKYSDIAERIIYNGFLSGVSLNGDAFFYENANEIDPLFKDVDVSIVRKSKRHMPITERVKVFWCSCCPPNDIRFFASIANLIYTYNEETLFVNQFMTSDAKIENGEFKITTNYPNDEKVTISCKNSKFKNIAVRKPSWCFSFDANRKYTEKDGYLYFEASGDDKIEVIFKMEVKLYQAHTNVSNNAGRIALTYGPFIYCLEGIDNGKHLRSIFLDKNTEFKVEFNKEYNAPVIYANGFKKVQKDTTLYSLFDENYEKTNLKFIPYFTFANRGTTEMIIWIGVK